VEQFLNKTHKYQPAWEQGRADLTFNVRDGGEPHRNAKSAELWAPILYGITEEERPIIEGT
jgi:hypothetical protein